MKVLARELRERLQESWLWRIARPGYPDGARLVAQGAVLRRLLQRRPFYGKCLHAGCGDGLFLPLLQACPRVTAIVNVDVSMRRDLSSLFPDVRNTFVEASLTELPFPDGSFDAVLCTEVIEHIPDDVKALAELHRVLTPHGHVLISVPQPPAPFDPAHVREGYTLAELTAKVERVGLQVVEHEDALFLGTRLLMRYWRTPLLRFSEARTPYVPQALVSAAGRFDVTLALGSPWDLVIVAERA